MKCFFAPTDFVENAWRWNYQRSEAEMLLGEDIHVAKVRWLRQKVTNDIQSFVIWPDSVKIIFPLFCDSVLLMQSATEQVSLFSRILGKKDEQKDQIELLEMKELVKRGIFEGTELNGLSCLRYDGASTKEFTGLFTKPHADFTEFYEWLSPESVFEADIAE